MALPWSLLEAGNVLIVILSQSQALQIFIMILKFIVAILTRKLAQIMEEGAGSTIILLQT